MTYFLITTLPHVEVQRELNTQCDFHESTITCCPPHNFSTPSSIHRQQPLSFVLFFSVFFNKNYKNIYSKASNRGLFSCFFKKPVRRYIQQNVLRYEIVSCHKARLAGGSAELNAGEWAVQASLDSHSLGTDRKKGQSKRRKSTNRREN